MTRVEILPTRLRRALPARCEAGFTLIELLVVILIIGILAAIAIPAFTNQRGKAVDAKAKSDLRNGQTAMETYYLDHQSYANATPQALTDIEPSLAGSGIQMNMVTDNSYQLYIFGSVTQVVDPYVGTAQTIYHIVRRPDGSTYRYCRPVGVNGCNNPGNAW